MIYVSSYIVQNYGQGCSKRYSHEDELFSSLGAILTPITRCMLELVKRNKTKLIEYWTILNYVENLKQDETLK